MCIAPWSPSGKFPNNTKIAVFSLVALTRLTTCWLWKFLGNTLRLSHLSRFSFSAFLKHWVKHFLSTLRQDLKNPLRESQVSDSQSELRWVNFNWDWVLIYIYSWIELWLCHLLWTFFIAWHAFPKNDLSISCSQPLFLSFIIVVVYLCVHVCSFAIAKWKITAIIFEDQKWVVSGSTKQAGLT